MSSTKYRDILNFLRENGLSETESNLLSELKAKNVDLTTLVEDDEKDVTGVDTTATSDTSTALLNSYENDQIESNTTTYANAYKYLLAFVQNPALLDNCRDELSLIIYPVFVHMYLELVFNGHESQAISFLLEFAPYQESFYAEDIKKLSFITKKQHMIGSELISSFKTSQFTVKMCRDTYTHLRSQKSTVDQQREHSIIWNTLQDHIYLDIYEGVARSREQIDVASGGMMGEANRQANKMRVFNGLFKEPDVSSFLNNQEILLDSGGEEDGGGSVGASANRKKKMRRDLWSLRRVKSDVTAPNVSRIPLPDVRDIDKLDRAKALKDFSRRQRLSAKEGSLPSACFYTLTNVNDMVCSVDISDDSTLLALGLSDSSIKVWSLLSQKLKGIKSTEALMQIDPDVDDVMQKIIDDSSGSLSKVLKGHSGSVHGLSFSSDKTTLLSCSEDGTIRLWSLQTWSCVVAFRGHVLPVWCVSFCPSNSGLTGPAASFYFASGGRDTTVRLWNTEQTTAIRVFVGHRADVNCLAFHPNYNYIASAADDRQIRLWDCLSGSCHRLLSGHKSAVTSLKFSPNGRLLVSGASSVGSLEGPLSIMPTLVWDIASGDLLAQFEQTSSQKFSLITDIAFSREGGMIATSSTSNSVTLWDLEWLENGTGSTVAVSSSSTSASSSGTSTTGNDKLTGSVGGTGSNTSEQIVSHPAHSSIPIVASDQKTKNRSNDKTTNKCFIKTFYSKSAAVVNLHFTRRNLLIGVGALQSS